MSHFPLKTRKQRLFNQVCTRALLYTLQKFIVIVDYIDYQLALSKYRERVDHISKNYTKTRLKVVSSISTLDNYIENHDNPSTEMPNFIRMLRLSTHIIHKKKLEDRLESLLLDRDENLSKLIVPVKYSDYKWYTDKALDRTGLFNLPVDVILYIFSFISNKMKRSLFGLCKYSTSLIISNPLVFGLEIYEIKI